MPPSPSPAERVLVALDVPGLDEADALLGRVAGVLSGCKIGSQLFTAAGPAAIELARKRGFRVFLDLKFHDIPTTVAKAGVEAARLGVRFFDLHASGSLQMMTRTRAEVARVCRREGLRRPRILAVTVLTSLARRDLRLVGVDGDVEHQVVRLARLARRAEMDGVVASPLEIARIRRQAGPGFVIVTPGIRPPAAALDDQKRVLTPGEAMRAGADYLVVGRPIRDAPEPLAVAREVLADMARGLLTSRARPASP